MKRDYSFDLIRIIAMMLIIIMHSPISGIGTPGIILSTISFLTAPGIGLFFMISGALLLGNNLPQTDFLRHRFKKIVYPTLFWTIVYIIVEYFNKPISFSGLIKIIFSIPFEKQGHGVLWFMYTLAGLYLLTPILSRWLKNASKKDLEFYLVLWAITLLFPYLKLILKINTDVSGILYYFAGYSGYFLLGYYLKQYVLPQGISKSKIIVCVCSIIVCILIVFAAKKINQDITIAEYFWYLTLPMAIMSLSYFILLSKIKVHTKYQSLIVKLSSLSFGVYFCHILVMRFFKWNIVFIQSSIPIAHIPVISILTIIVSWFLVYLISKLQIRKFIIGI